MHPWSDIVPVCHRTFIFAAHRTCLQSADPSAGCYNSLSPHAAMCALLRGSHLVAVSSNRTPRSVSTLRRLSSPADTMLLRDRYRVYLDAYVAPTKCHILA